MAGLEGPCVPMYFFFRSRLRSPRASWKRGEVHANDLRVWYDQLTFVWGNKRLRMLAKVQGRLSRIHHG